MSFSYDPTMLDQPINYIRFKIGDTDPEYVQFQDEEIQFFINQYPQPISIKDQNKVAISLLKQQLLTIMKSPSRERAGAYEVYSQSAEMIKLLIDEIEDEIKDNLGLAVPSFGGVYRADVCRTRNNPAYTDNRFYDGVIYCDCGCGREKGSHPLV